MNAEMVGGDGGDAVCFVQDDKIIGKENAGLLTTGWHAGIDECEEETVVNDDAVGLLKLLSCSLVETGSRIAVFSGTGGAVGIDGVPDIGERWRREFLNDPVGALGRPFREADEIGFFIAWKEVALSALSVFEGVFESGGTAVIPASDHQCGFEGGIGVEFRKGFKEFSADFEILVTNVFLKGDGVAGDDTGSFGGDGMEESGDEVGEAFADTGAGFKEEGFSGFKGIGNRECHGVLLGAMIELKHGLQVAAFFEDRFYKRHEVACGGGAAAVFN